MKIVKVTYTTTAGFVDQNQANIRKVMAELQKMNNKGINYNACLSADGRTFIHTAFFKSEEEEQVLLNLPLFKEFQMQLKANGFEVPPKQEVLTLVGASVSLFD